MALAGGVSGWDYTFQNTLSLYYIQNVFFLIKRIDYGKTNKHKNIFLINLAYNISLFRPLTNFMWILGEFEKIIKNLYRDVYVELYQAQSK